ncbi:MAG: DUF1540 domain-containing protein [Clostridia bacterium]|nr:DUF1540 domain-containing protein [Clostridia bacterium]
MVDLKCSKEDCRFNKAKNCTANKISVDECANCTSYEKSSKPHKHEEDKIPQAFVRHNTNVICSADCLFMRNCICTANGISVIEDIKTSKKAPSCATILPK